MYLHDPGTMTDTVERLKNVVLSRAVSRGDFKLSSGARSSYYIDCRRVTMSYAGLFLAGDAIVKCVLCARLDPDVVCGPESAGIPLACAVTMAADKSYLSIEGCFVRKESRGHGMGKMVEGYPVHGGSRVLMVEDVVTTGSSLIRAIEAVRATGASVVGAVVLVDRLQGAGEKIEGMGVPFHALMTIKDLGLE